MTWAPANPLHENVIRLEALLVGHFLLVLFVNGER